MASAYDAIMAAQRVYGGNQAIENQKLMQEQRRQAIQQQERRSQLMQQYPELQVGGPVAQGAALMRMHGGQQKVPAGQPTASPASQAQGGAQQMTQTPMQDSLRDYVHNRLMPKSQFQQEIGSALQSGAIRQEDIPNIMREHIRKQIMSSGGVQTGYDESGRPTVSVGGPAAGHPDFRFSTDPQSAQQDPGMQPGMLRGGRGTAGTTFVDPSSGAFTSLPSGAQVSSIQQQIRSIGSLRPMLANLKKYGSGYSPVTRGWGSPQNRADYESTLSAVKDSMIKAYNLPQVQASLDTVENMVKRYPMETDQHYTNRIDRISDHLSQLEESNKGMLRRGMRLDPGSQQAPISVPREDVSRRTSPVSMPNFGTKQEFQNWYKALSTSQREKVKSRMGG